MLTLAGAALTSACNGLPTYVALEPSSPASNAKASSSATASSGNGAAPASLATSAEPTTTPHPLTVTAQKSSDDGPALPTRITGVEPITVPPGETLTFDKAYAIAETRNASLLGLRRAVERSRVNYQSVAAGYASDWQATAFGRLQPPIDTGATPNTPFVVNPGAGTGAATSNLAGGYYDLAGAELRWTLPWWHKEGVKFDAQSSQIDIAVAQENYEAAEKDQTVNLLKAYIQVRLYQEKVRVSAEQLKVDSARRDSMQKGQKIGKQSDLDLITQEGDLHNQEAITSHLEYQSLLKMQTLFDTLNVPRVDVKFCRNYFEYFTFDASKWNSNWAVEEQSRKLNLQIAKQEIQKQKADVVWEPSLALSSAYWHQWEEVRPYYDENVVTLGATVTVPIPNFEQSAATQELARHDMNDLLAQLDEEVLRTKRVAVDDGQQISVLAANLKKRLVALQAFAKQLADTRKSYDLGLITYLQVQTTENSIQQNTQQFYDDMSDYINLVIDYARLYGRPFPVPTSCKTG